MPTRKSRYRSNVSTIWMLCLSSQLAKLLGPKWEPVGKNWANWLGPSWASWLGPKWANWVLSGAHICPSGSHVANAPWDLNGTQVGKTGQSGQNWDLHGNEHQLTAGSTFSSLQGFNLFSKLHNFKHYQFWVQIWQKICINVHDRYHCTYNATSTTCTLHPVLLHEQPVEVLAKMLDCIVCKW